MSAGDTKQERLEAHPDRACALRIPMEEVWTHRDNDPEKGQRARKTNVGGNWKETLRSEPAFSHSESSFILTKP